MKLTAATARQIRPGQIIRDDVVRGLQLHGRQSGASWLYWYVAPDGAERRPRLGHYPTLGIEAAREVARQYAKAVALGGDPSQDKRAIREAPTMDELFALYLQHVDKRKRERSIEEDRRNWRVHVSPRIGNLKAAAVTEPDLSTLLAAVAVVRFKPRPDRKQNPTEADATYAARKPAAPVKIGGATAANRVRALLSGVLTFAERSTVNVRPRGSNPIRETEKRPEKRRRRHIERAEFQAVYAGLAKHAERYPRHVAALRCTLYCGTRVSELLTAKWAWLDGQLLRLPEHKTMRITGEARLVRLPQQALDVLAALPRDSSGLLFGAGLDRWSIGKVWRRIVREAGCPDIQPRDLRRTFASVAKTTGATLEHVGEILGHGFGDPTVTAGYAYLYGDAAAAVTQRTADEIDKLGTGKG